MLGRGPASPFCCCSSAARATASVALLKLSIAPPAPRSTQSSVTSAISRGYAARDGSEDERDQRLLQPPAVALADIGLLAGQHDDALFHVELVERQRREGVV